MVVVKLASLHRGPGTHPAQARNRDPVRCVLLRPQLRVIQPNLSPVPTLLVRADRMQHRGVQGRSNLFQPPAAHLTQEHEPY
jgi:hypothetical protein